MHAEPEVSEARGGHRPDWRAVRPGRAMPDRRDDEGCELSDDAPGLAAPCPDGLPECGGT